MYIQYYLSCLYPCRHLGSQLAELENIIERMLQEDFGKCVSSDLNRPIADTEPLMEEVCQSLTLNLYLQVHCNCSHYLYLSKLMEDL